MAVWPNNVRTCEQRGALAANRLPRQILMLTRHIVFFCRLDMTLRGNLEHQKWKRGNFTHTLLSPCDRGSLAQRLLLQEIGALRFGNSGSHRTVRLHQYQY